MHLEFFLTSIGISISGSLFSSRQKNQDHYILVWTGTKVLLSENKRKILNMIIAENSEVTTFYVISIMNFKIADIMIQIIIYIEKKIYKRRFKSQQIQIVV